MKIWLCGLLNIKLSPIANLTQGRKERKETQGEGQ